MVLPQGSSRLTGIDIATHQSAVKLVAIGSRSTRRASRSAGGAGLPFSTQTLRKRNQELNAGPREGRNALSPLARPSAQIARHPIGTPVRIAPGGKQRSPQFDGLRAAKMGVELARWPRARLPIAPRGSAGIGSPMGSTAADRRNDGSRRGRRGRATWL